MSTVANIKNYSEGGHWYSLAGKPMHEVDKADGSGTTPTTLRHAKKLNLLPSVTTYLKILDKPALTAWKVEQAVLAVMTTPRLPEEADDAFIHRVLSKDKEQDKERDAAAQFGTAIHAEIEHALAGESVGAEMQQYVAPVLAELNKFGKLKASEVVVVGAGYAGRTDVIMESDDEITVIDFKTTKAKKLPTESYAEHKCQLAAYGQSFRSSGKKIRGVNIYISTVNKGEISVCNNLPEEIEAAYGAFEKIVGVWQWMNKYKPQQ